LFEGRIMTSGSIIISAKHSLSHGQAGISFGLANMEISSAQYNKAQLWPTAREQSTDRREGRRSRRTPVWRWEAEEGNAVIDGTSCRRRTVAADPRLLASLVLHLSSGSFLLLTRFIRAFSLGPSEIASRICSCVLNRAIRVSFPLDFGAIIICTARRNPSAGGSDWSGTFRRIRC